MTIVSVKKTIPVRITSSGDPDPGVVSCVPGNRIAWVNESGETVASFDLPECFTSRKSPRPVKHGKRSDSRTIGKKHQGKFEYVYRWEDASKGTRSGTIDVGSS